MFVEVIIQLVGSALAIKDNIVNNKKKCRLLIEWLEAIRQPLREIVASESTNRVAHQEPLEKLQVVVTEAKELLEKQCQKSTISQYFSSSSAKAQIDDVTQRMKAHVQALNLSVAVRQRL